MVTYKHFKLSLSSRFLPGFVLFWALTLFAGASRAQIVQWPTLEIQNPAAYVEFVDPNEKKPIEQLPILSLAKPGLLMTVGTERGFIAAALGNKITEVLFIDRTPGIVLFNQINIELLRIAKNREHYLSLRFPKNFAAWNEASSALLKNIDAQIFWSHNVLSNSFFNLFHHAESDEYKSFVKKVGYEPFKNANYLTDDALFDRLHKLAVENKMQAVNVDMNRSEFINLIDKLKSSKKEIGIIDVSNAWSPAYMGTESTARLLENLDKIAKPDTVFLFTRATGGNWETGWRYEAFDFNFLRTSAPRAYGFFYLKYMTKSGYFPNSTDSSVYNGSDARQKVCENAFGSLKVNKRNSLFFNIFN